MKRLVLTLALLALGASAQDLPPERVAAAALRDPRGLPAAPQGHWSDWRPETPLPEEHRERLQQASRAYLRGDYPVALAAYWLLLHEEPDFPPALYQLGVTYFRLRRYGDCVSVFERFVSVAPSQVGATQALAHGHYSLGDYEAARAHYERVLAANPDSVEAVRGQALTHMRLGLLESSLELFDRCLELRPDHLEAHHGRGRVLFDLGRSEDAREAALAARELDPFDPRPWFLLSQVLFDLGEDDEAEAAEARFLELNDLSQKVRALEADLIDDPGRADVLRRLVDVHRASGNLAGVRATFERWIRAAPRDLGVRSFALETMRGLEMLADCEGIVGGMERDFPREAEAWRVLRDHYGALEDRVQQVRAGERYLRFGGDPGR